MKLSPAGWLYNAGVVGLLRIISWGEDDENLPRKILRNGLEPHNLERFSLYYWAYAARHFLYHEISPSLWNILTKLLTPGKGRDEEGRAKTSQLLGELRASVLKVKIPQRSEDMEEDYRRFVGEIEFQFENWYANILMPSVEAIEEKPRNWEKNLEKIRGILESYVDGIMTFQYQSNALGRYYFNKSVVNNPKKAFNRLEKFHKEFVEPAIGVLESGTSSHGEEFYTCTFCGRSYPLDKKWMNHIVFTEGDFAPIGVSYDKFQNFFYNGEAPLKCPVCQLILLSSYAGFNRKPFILQDLEGTDHIFINLPDLSDAFRINEQFGTLLRDLSEGIIHERDNLYYAGIRIILTSLKKKSQWVLNNVLFVEFKPTPEKRTNKPSFVYFNIDRGAAQVFKELGDGDGKRLENLLKSLNWTYEWHNQRIYLSTEVLKRLLERKSLKPLIFAYFKDFVNGRHGNIAGLWTMVLFEHLFNQARRALQRGKKEVKVMDIYRRLWALRKAGENAFSLSEIDRDKRRRLAQRFITLIRGGRKEEFYTELLRLYLVYKKENLAGEIFSLLSEDEHLTFQEKALAWLTGFVSPASGEVQEDRMENTSDKQEVAR